MHATTHPRYKPLRASRPGGRDGDRDRRVAAQALAAGRRRSRVRYANNRLVWINLRDRFPHPYTMSDAISWVQRASAQDPPTNLAIATTGEAIGSIGLTLQTDVHPTIRRDWLLARRALLGQWHRHSRPARLHRVRFHHLRLDPSIRHPLRVKPCLRPRAGEGRFLVRGSPEQERHQGRSDRGCVDVWTGPVAPCSSRCPTLTRCVGRRERSRGDYRYTVGREGR